MKFSAALLISFLLIASLVRAESEFTVMSFNIRYGTADDGPNAWQHRKELLFETIKHSMPDILGTQECLAFQAEAIEENLKRYDRFGTGRNADGTGERMEIFYNTNSVSLLEAASFWLSPTPEIPGSTAWDAANIRMVTWGKFYHFEAEKSFYLLNTHFDHVSEKARVASASLVAEFAKDLPETSPVILTGDFNSKADASESYKILTISGLLDARNAAQSVVGPATTWCGFAAPDPASDRRIDWILYRGPIIATRYETVTYNQDGRFPSDHLPVFAQFRWNRD